MSLFQNLTTKQRDWPIYRILKPSRLIELFQDEQGVLVHPSRWEDPYENFILRARVRGIDGKVRAYDYHKNLYGQCWTLNQASDAMWRIYSHNFRGVRIRTTVKKLLSSLYHGGVCRPDMFCAIGRVEYLAEKRLYEFANNIYYGGKLSKDDLFKSLLVKRRAFAHEKEVRLLYFDSDGTGDGQVYRFKLKPHELVEQIMLDPRLSHDEFQTMKSKIKRLTGFAGPMLRSRLYTPPEEMILRDTPP